MNEALGKRAILVTSVMYIVFPLLMALKEYPLLLGPEHFPYLVGRLAVILVSLLYFILALFDRTPQHYPIAFYLVGLTYAAHGQYFQPNYWLAMIELNALFPLFFLINAKVIYILYGIGLIAFNTSFFYFSQRFIQANAFSESLRNDIMIGTVITAIIALVTYRNLIVARVARTRLLQRFVDVGKNFSFIIHDLKGMIATPSIYASMLQKAVESNGYSDNEKNLVRQLKDDLNSIKVFVTETTRLVAAEFSNEDRRKFVRISESVDLVKVLLKSKLRKTQVIQIGDISINSKLELINRIFINIISNAIDAFIKSTTEEKEIKIICKDNTVLVTDNSGSKLSSDSLKKLNSLSSSFTTKAEGSGIGTLIIKDYMASLEGQVKYTNGDTGVVVTLVFPKKAINTATQQMTTSPIPLTKEEKKSFNG